MNAVAVSHGEHDWPAGQSSYTSPQGLTALKSGLSPASLVCQLMSACLCCGRHVASGLQPGLCLQASLNGLIALTAGCNQEFLQWDFYLASGASAALNHSATGLCLYPSGRLPACSCLLLLLLQQWTAHGYYGSSSMAMGAFDFMLVCLHSQRLPQQP